MAVEGQGCYISPRPATEKMNLWKLNAGLADVILVLTGAYPFPLPGTSHILSLKEIILMAGAGRKRITWWRLEDVFVTTRRHQGGCPSLIHQRPVCERDVVGGR